MAQRFLVVDGILVENNCPIWEVVEDDGYYTTHGFYYHEDEAHCAARRLEQEREARKGTEE